ncbi:MAG TPA: hypothetical protein VI729_13695, partial [Anaerolineales bacterium]|nr:hypothetical protein [Anaerolineales bacterium]
DIRLYDLSPLSDFTRRRAGQEFLTTSLIHLTAHVKIVGASPYPSVIFLAFLKREFTKRLEMP